MLRIYLTKRIAEVVVNSSYMHHATKENLSVVVALLWSWRDAQSSIAEFPFFVIASSKLFFS